jgi:hypothetical protein
VTAVTELSLNKVQGKEQMTMALPSALLLKLRAYYYRLDWAKKVSLAAICLVAGSASFGLREN